MIWLWRIAPINPSIAISRRNTPQAINPPSAGMETITASFFAAAVIPIKIKPINYKK